jgi:type II secretory pathway predicted ATPase ExeA
MRRPPNLMKSTTQPAMGHADDKPAPPANYLDLYGLSKPPFGEGQDGAGYILFGSHRRPFELLIDHVVNGSGVILLQGGEGIGKTQTLRSVADLAAESGLRAIMISRPPNGQINVGRFKSALQDSPALGGGTAADVIAQFVAPPRKALLVDDVDLMPADCVQLLSALVQRMPKDPGGPAIVLSTTPSLDGEPARPDLSQIVGLARNTLRLLPLGPAEVRQYIERSLWVAGGTTRRLIAADAMKLLIARSGGAPGVINRLMEAVLTAGFARVDSIITAKTVAAVAGPPTPRPRVPSDRPASGRAQQVMQIAAMGLLISGASVFLYKALNGKADHRSSDLAKPIALDTHLAPPVARPQEPVARPQESLARPPDQPPKPPETLPPELMAVLVKRGDEALGLGDIAAARMLYQRAAEAGNAPAATALGKTYDPNFAAPGSKPDPPRAAEWYKKAIALGDLHATDLLQRLVVR